MARPALIHHGIAALALALPVALLAPPTAHAATPPSWAASSTGTLVFVNAADIPPTDVGRAGLGQAASGAQSTAPLAAPRDSLRQPLLVASGAGKTAYSHTSGLNAGLLSAATDKPQVAQTLAEATSPTPTTDAGDLVALPADPLLSATVLPGAVKADSGSGNPCATGSSSIAQATSRVAQATAVMGIAQLGGTSETVTRTNVVGASLESSSTQTLAPLTLLSGTPAQTTVTVLGPVQLLTRAGGTRGSSAVSYGIAGKSGTDPVVTVSAGGKTVSLTAQQVFGGKGLVLPLGIADLTIGAPVHALSGLEGTSPSAAADGTEASAAADLLRLTVPGALSTPGQDPVDGPLAPLNAALNPLLTAAKPVLATLQSALTKAGLGVADVRLGHQESSVRVPAGGITCSTSDVVGNPLSEARTDASAQGVASGQDFTYTVRVPNRGTLPLTDVRVEDTWTGGETLVATQPSPISRGTSSAGFTLGTLEPGAFKTVVLTFRAPPGDGVGMHNIAVVTGRLPNGSVVTVPVKAWGPTTQAAPSGACDLSASTTWASNKTVLTGERFAYVVDALNSGGQSCRTVTITEPLDSGVTFVSCTASCTHTSQHVTWVVGPLGAGASTTVMAIVSTKATSGTLPSTATLTPSSGTAGHVSESAPRVTTQSAAQPAVLPLLNAAATSASASRGDLPMTGMPAPVAVIGLGLLGTALATRLVRTRRAP